MAQMGRLTLGFNMLLACHAEKVWLEGLTVPAKDNVMGLHLFQIPEGKARLTMTEPIVYKTGYSGEALDFALVKAENFSPPATEADKNPFVCCAAAGGNCEAANKLEKRDTLVKVNVAKRGFAIDGLSAGEWLLVSANCGSTPEQGASDLITGGEMSVSHPHGYVPGWELNNMYFYGMLMAAYLVLFGGYSALVYTWRDVSLSLHFYLCLGAFAGMLECACWYASLYHWNLVGHRWKSMQGIAVAGTWFKRACCWWGFLMITKGTGICVKSVPWSTTLKAFLLMTMYGACHVVHASTGKVSVTYDNVYFLTSNDAQFGSSAAENVSLVVEAVALLWVVSALDATLKELETANQPTKYNFYQTMQTAITVTLLCTIAVQSMFLAYDHFVVGSEASVAAHVRMLHRDLLFSHVGAHVFFFLCLAGMMVAMRPSERSKDLAFYESIDDPEAAVVVADVNDEDEDLEESVFGEVEMANK